MSYILNFFAGTFRLFFKYWRVLPKGMLSLFIVFTFIIEIFTKGFSYAFTNLAQSILSAELTINKIVHLAIINSTEYTLVSFFSVFSSVMILYYLTKFIGEFLIKMTGSQAVAMAYIVSILIVGIIEVSAIAVIDGNLGFIPIKDGLYFLGRNIVPVFQNINFF